MKIKPIISQAELLALLAEIFTAPVTAVQPINAGQIAKAFFFAAGGNEYVIRFTQPNMGMGLQKDQYAYKHFAAPRLPIPPVVRMDEYRGYPYAITRRMKGKPLEDFTGEAYAALIPSLVETLDAIHQTDVSGTTGYGSFDGQGAGLFASWPEFLLHVGNEEDDGGFYGKWHGLFETTFLDRGLFDEIYAEMKALLPFCPAERYLVHADYAFSNVLAAGERVTAVLDWANAYYGDFLFDVAWLIVGMEGVDFDGRFRRYYQSQRRTIPHYNERLRCCACYICLDAFRFYAKTGKESDYHWMKKRILHILERL